MTPVASPSRRTIPIFERETERKIRKSACVTFGDLQLAECGPHAVPGDPGKKDGKEIADTLRNQFVL